MEAEIYSINISSKKGKKFPVKEAHFICGWGIEGDYHAGKERHVSLLQKEKIDEYGVLPGSFGENITIVGGSFEDICIGQNLFIEGGVILKIKEIGKDCSVPCKIKQEIGDCIMPRFGIFADVVKGGLVKEGLKIKKEDVFLVSILTVSDSVYDGRREDKSKEAIEAYLLEKKYYFLLDYKVINDEKESIKESIKELAKKSDLLLTCGGTGVSPRDVTPEATEEVLQKKLPGFAECMRIHSYALTPYAIISRGTAGFLETCLVVNLPGSPKGAVECLSFIERAIPHAIKVARGEDRECARR